MFYGIYLVKQWKRKRRGIQTMQIGRGKDTQTHAVETLMGIATVGIIPAQLLSIAFGWSHLSANARFSGFCVGMLGDLSFLISVLSMKDSWRAGIPSEKRNISGHAAKHGVSFCCSFVNDVRLGKRRKSYRIRKAVSSSCRF